MDKLDSPKVNEHSPMIKCEEQKDEFVAVNSGSYQNNSEFDLITKNLTFPEEDSCKSPFKYETYCTNCSKEKNKENIGGFNKGIDDIEKTSCCNVEQNSKFEEITLLDTGQVASTVINEKLEESTKGNDTSETGYFSQQSTVVLPQALELPLSYNAETLVTKCVELPFTQVESQIVIDNIIELKNVPDTSMSLLSNHTLPIWNPPQPMPIPQMFNFKADSLVQELYNNAEVDCTKSEDNGNDVEFDAHLPLKKRKLSIPTPKISEPNPVQSSSAMLNVVQSTRSNKEISYPATPMLSVADVLIMRPFKTPAEKKVFPEYL